MKKIMDLILFGFVLQTPPIVLVVLLGLIWQFYDSFYNRFVIRWIFGKEISGLGFLLGLAVAIILGVVAQPTRGWNFIKRIFNTTPFTRWIIDFAEQWIMFRDLAVRQGVILAPYYRDRSTFWPGVVTNLIPKEEGGYLITVAFGDIPAPKPSLLVEDDIIYVRLTFSEAVSYILSGGLALRMFGRKLKRQTLGEYVRTNSTILESLEGSN